MKRIGILLALLLIAAPVGAQAIGPTCTLAWNGVTTNADGTPITTPVTEYRVYRQAVPSPPPTTGGVTVARIPAPATTWNCAPLGPGQHNVWLTAYNGIESALSTNSTAVPPVAGVPLSFTLVVTPPAFPGGLRVTP